MSEEDPRFPPYLLASEIEVLARHGRRPARPSGWSTAPDAELQLDAHAAEFLAALERERSSERENLDLVNPLQSNLASAPDPHDSLAADALGGAGHGASRSRRVPTSRAITVVIVCALPALGLFAAGSSSLAAQETAAQEALELTEMIERIP